MENAKQLILPSEVTKDNIYAFIKQDRPEILIAELMVAEKWQEVADQIKLQKREVLERTINSLMVTIADFADASLLHIALYTKAPLDIIYELNRLRMKRLDALQRTFLHAAAMSGNISGFHWCMEQGMEMIVVDKMQTNILHYAAKGGYTSMLHVVLKKHRRYGMDLIHGNDEDGNTPLHIAADYGHASFVISLIQYGACIDARDHLGATPLHYACTEKKHTCIKNLVLWGAKLNAQTNSGRTPLDYCIKEEDEVGAMYLARKGAALDHPPDLNQIMYSVQKNSKLLLWTKKQATLRRRLEFMEKKGAWSIFDALLVVSLPMKYPDSVASILSPDLIRHVKSYLY
jgi:ankyrin repeat protein